MADQLARRLTNLEDLDPLDFPKNTFTETRPPTVDDDSTLGFSVGSTWIDITHDVVYTCVGATAGGAVWEPSRFFTATDGGGLTLNYAGGRFLGVGASGFSFNTLPAGSVGLTDNTTNYVQITTTGTVFSSSSGFFTTSFPLAEVVTLAGSITSIIQRWFNSGTIGDRYHGTNTAFPQQLWGLANATTTGFLDMEMGVFQINGLNGAGANRNVRVGGSGTQTGQLETTNGTAALPSKTFISDLTSGMFLIAGTRVGISYAGLEGLGVDNASAGGETSIQVLHNDGVSTSFKRVSADAVDTAGVGFRSLRVPN